MIEDTSETRTISQPPTYWAAFAAAAKRCRKSLSAWVASAGVAHLPDDLAEGLTPRRGPGREKKGAKE